MDVKPDLDSTELSVRAMLKGEVGVKLERTEERLNVHSQPDGELLLYIEMADGLPTIFTEPWHGHFDSGEELAIYLSWILGGYCKLVAEYHGDDMVACGLMVYDGTDFDLNKPAFYVNPYRPELWEKSLAGPVKGKVTAWNYIDASADLLARIPNAELDQRRLPPGLALGTYEHEDLTPMLVHIDYGYAWFQRRLGRPAEGMRWTCDGEGHFFFQVPSEWSDMDFQEDDPRCGCQLPDSAIYIIAHLVECEAKDAEVEEPLVSPSDIAAAEALLTEDGQAYAERSWRIGFEGDGCGLEVYLSLRCPADQESDAAFQQAADMIQMTVEFSRFAPGELPEYSWPGPDETGPSE